jgi:hypothetical protein
LALRDKANAADRQNKVVVVSGSIAGVALTSGLVLVLLNQPRRVKTGEKSRLAPASQAGLSISPAVEGGKRSWLARYGLVF